MSGFSHVTQHHQAPWRAIELGNRHVSDCVSKLSMNSILHLLRHVIQLGISSCPPLATRFKQLLREIYSFDLICCISHSSSLSSRQESRRSTLLLLLRLLLRQLLSTLCSCRSLSDCFPRASSLFELHALIRGLLALVSVVVIAAVAFVNSRVAGF